MSISDTLMWRYYQLLLRTPDTAIAKMQQAVQDGASHPMELKKALAHAIITQFWGIRDADDAQLRFQELFQRKDYQHAQIVTLPSHSNSELWIVDLLKTIGAITSSSEGKRLIESRAVEIDGVIIDDFKAMINWMHGTVVRVGKTRFYKIQ